MKTRLLLLLLIITGFAQAQVTNRIQGDSIRINQVGNAPAELILENKTKNRAGAVLKNRGGGRTEFDYVVDSAWVTADTLYLKRGPVIMKIRKSGLGANDTTAANGVPAIASGWWAQQQIAAQPSLQEAYVVNGDTLGIDFKDATGKVYFRWLFDSGDQAAVEYLRKINAGNGLAVVNDSTLRADTSILATKATLTQQVNILEAAKLNVNPAISGGTYLKITYDSKGLVTSGANATTSDVSEGSNLYYTDSRARAAITVTTNGTSGPASIVNGVINIPQYAGTGGTFPAIYSAPGDGNTAHISNTGSDTIINFYNAGILRSRITQNGWQEWYLRSGTEVGSIRYFTPGDLPGVAFYNGAYRAYWAIGAGGSGQEWWNNAASTWQMKLTSAGKLQVPADIETGLLSLTPKASMPALAAGQIGVGADGELYIGKGGVNHTAITANNVGNVAIPGNTSAGGNIAVGSSTTAADRMFSQTTAKGYFSIITDGVNNAGGTTIGYSWANGGQGPLNFADASRRTARMDTAFTWNPDGTRPIMLTNGGTIWMPTDAQGWRTGIHWRNKLSADIGGFGARGQDNALSALYIGASDLDPIIYATPGNKRVGFGGNTNPQEAIDVTGNVRVSSLTAGRLVATDASKNLISAGLYGFAQTAINTTAQTITLTAGAIEQVVYLGGTATSVTLPTPVDNVKLWVRNTTASPITISGNAIKDDDTDRSTIPARTGYQLTKDGTFWRRLL